MGASVVTCCDAPPVFKLGKHVLDFVALFVECLVIIDGLLSVFPAWDARCNAPCGKLIAKPVAVIAAIGMSVPARGNWFNRSCAPL